MRGCGSADARVILVMSLRLVCVVAVVDLVVAAVILGAGRMLATLQTIFVAEFRGLWMVCTFHTTRRSERSTRNLDRAALQNMHTPPMPTADADRRLLPPMPPIDIYRHFKELSQVCRAP